MRTKILLSVLSISLIINGVFVYNNIKRSSFYSSDQENFYLLSKRIFVENQNDILINFIPLRSALKEYAEKKDSKVGVYFEYLPSGTSIGVNDKEEVRLASLSKVPIAMSIFKKIERGEMSLNDTLVIEEKNLNHRFGDLWQQGEGTHVSVEELLRLALTESDNTAYYTLYDQLTYDEVKEVYEGLDITIGQEKEGDVLYPLVSPKNYSSIFRSLYLSSFLSKENSSYILHILTHTIFKDKIVAGVPSTVVVAHKIGVFEEYNSSKNVFIDCGIVYVPNRPYILCAFVRGTDEEAQKHISTLSKMIYEYVVAIKGGK